MRRTGGCPCMLCDLARYDFDALPAKSRNKVRKCWKTNEIVQVIEPRVLRDQGYDVRCSVHQRTGMWKPPSEVEYVAGLDKYMENPCRLVLAGLAEGRLRGYLDGFAVDGTAYLDHLYVHSDALRTENWEPVSCSSSSRPAGAPAGYARSCTASMSRRTRVSSSAKKKWGSRW